MATRESPNADNPSGTYESDDDDDEEVTFEPKKAFKAMFKKEVRTERPQHDKISVFRKNEGEEPKTESYFFDGQEIDKSVEESPDKLSDEEIKIARARLSESLKESRHNDGNLEDPIETETTLDNFEDGVIAGHEPEVSMTTALAEAGFEQAEISKIIEEVTRPIEKVKGEEELEPDFIEAEMAETDEDDQEPVDETELKLDHAPESSTLEHDEDDTTAPQAIATASVTPPPIPPPVSVPPAVSTGPSSSGPTSAGGGMGGSGTPPPVGHGFGGMPPFGPGGGPTRVAPAFNMAPATANTDTYRPDYDRGNPAVTALIGGIIGYFIGRRRGRIKAEKRLIPIQKKLEKQVEDLHWDLKAKEAKIRQVMREKMAVKPAEEQPLPHAEQIVNEVVRPSKPNLGLQMAAEASLAPLVVRPEALKNERSIAPEAHQLHGETRTREHNIGHVLINVQPEAPKAVVPSRLEYIEPRTLARPEKPIVVMEKSVETLNRTELLDLSEKIQVEGSNLRQIYETHLVGEKGLRRLVAEHMHGGDLQKALRQEIVEREIDFERDPVMRDMPATQSGGGTPINDSSVALSQFLNKAEASLPAPSEEAAFFKAKANYEVKKNIDKQKQRRGLDVALISLIVVLIGLIVYMVIKH